LVDKRKTKVSKKRIISKFKNYYRRAKRLNELLGDLDKDKAVKEAAFKKKIKKAIAARQKD
jgi:hypothetical protein